jgi:hypothetical protein
MDVPVGTVRDLDFDRVVEPRRFCPIDGGNKLVSPHRIEVIDLDRDLEVAPPEWNDVNTG